MRRVYIETGGNIHTTRIFDFITGEPLEVERIEFSDLSADTGLGWTATLYASDESNPERTVIENVLIVELKTVRRKLVTSNGVY